MSLHLWAPRRPHPVPVAGTLLSLTTHGALLVAVVGADGSAAAGSGTGASSFAVTERVAHDGERLHWVGIRRGSGDEASPPERVRRDSSPPPVAYVVPGRGERQLGALSSRGLAGASEPEGPRYADRRAAERAGPPPARERPTPAPRRSRRLPLLPDLSVLEAQAAILVAGVLSASPDLTRRVSPPEDFVRVSPAELLSGRPARARSLAPNLVVSSVQVDELPIPLVSNPRPDYPTALERVGVGGRVIVEFVIDSTGLVDIASLRVVQSTNALFTQAVRHVLPQLRFVPAQLEQQAVGVTVQQPFLFTIRGAP